MNGRVLVIGGGISGLTAAYSLTRDAPGLDVRLAEAKSRVGGTLGSETIGGFVFERGPNGFLDNVPEALDLARELNLESRLLSPSPLAEKRFILKMGRLHVVPTTPAAFLRSGLLSIRGRLRVLTEPFRRRGGGGADDSVATFGRRRLGVEATETLLDPLVTGIHAADVERLSIASAFPRVARLEREYGSLFRGMLRLRKERRRRGAGSGGASGPAGPGGKLRSFPGGLEELTTALKQKLGDRLRLGSAAESVRPHGGQFEVIFRDGTTESADAVVAALPTPRAASLFASSQPGLARALEAIPYAPVAVVCLGYRREDVTHPLDGFGFLIPRNQGTRILGMIWTSSIFPAHAPDGAVSLRTLLGGARDPAIVEGSTEELVPLVQREAGQLLGLQGEPLESKVYRWVQGIPQYNLGHARRIEQIDTERHKLPGLFLAGNAYRGVGINDCVREAGRVSAEVRRHFDNASR